ncbi:peptidoglycan DD-metalloendopeptidase family protein [Marinomonas sp. 15G1-11]|uniref:Peptidoglycan DD-metalloendopeptidase family protein n=1 Tax=Marinomonas phaeophyticola TaxID=3004091 RepID=A0ABT4JZB6_9GAMM|nr:peptidoglycan DD-metalloendopeptidase family protein [Marinomonas sp. 15G1-11]MCZ2723628.1 peptidoglycan DD-metalloendopeptidase family protein [Marinomonas sp. 15G1-11]
MFNAFFQHYCNKENLAFCVALVMLLALSMTPLHAAEPTSPEEAQQQIELLQKEMKKLRVWLDDVKSQKSNVEKSLENQEKSIQELIEKINKIQLDLKKGDQQLGTLQRQQQELKLSIQKQNEQIAAQLRAVYRSGEQKSIKLLLNGSTPEESMRLVYYNRYFSNARQSLINGFSTEVNELDLVERSIRSQRAQLARNEVELQEERKRLEKEGVKRKRLLAQINADLQQGNKKSERLKQDENQLKELLKKLEEALADIDLLDADINFAELKGELFPPLAKIRVIAETGKVNLGGVSLRASEGEGVKAVYHGRVIFAEWLRGFGFLLILDHGGGYMSLYGYNQSLLKEVGEWVKTSDVIATAGSSGGRSDTSLFFAIRHNGTPLKPLDWIR